MSPRRTCLKMEVPISSRITRGAALTTGVGSWNNIRKLRRKLYTRHQFSFVEEWSRSSKAVLLFCKRAHSAMSLYWSPGDENKTQGWYKKSVFLMTAGDALHLESLPSGLWYKKEMKVNLDGSWLVTSLYLIIQCPIKMHARHFPLLMCAREITKSATWHAYTLNINWYDICLDCWMLSALLCDYLIPLSLGKQKSCFRHLSRYKLFNVH
jgi:hypothetical protein